MFSDARNSPRRKSLERLTYGILIGAAAINLGTNLLADVLAGPAQNPAGWLRLLLAVSKPMLVPALAGILFLSTRGASSTIRRGAFYAALFFCWLGDIALLSTQPLFFFLGLGAFGVAHLFFIRAYLPFDKSAYQWSDLVYGLPFVIYGYTLYSIIYWQLSHAQQPQPAQHIQALSIAGYMVVLLSNGAAGFLRLRQHQKPARSRILRSSASLLVGIVLFVQSDSIIAVTQYVNPLPIQRFAIMATYILGLFLMVRGCILDARESTPLLKAAEQPIPLAAAA